MENGPARLAIIRQMQEIVRHDAPWLFGLHPKTFSLYHGWVHNLKPNLMANNRLKYIRLDPAKRAVSRTAWNQPVLWPLFAVGALFLLLCVPALKAYRRRAERTATLQTEMTR